MARKNAILQQLEADLLVAKSKQLAAADEVALLQSQLTRFEKIVQKHAAKRKASAATPVATTPA